MNSAMQIFTINEYFNKHHNETADKTEMLQEQTKALDKTLRQN